MNLFSTPQSQPFQGNNGMQFNPPSGPNSHGGRNNNGNRGGNHRGGNRGNGNNRGGPRGGGGNGGGHNGNNHNNHHNNHQNNNNHHHSAPRQHQNNHGGHADNKFAPPKHDNPNPRYLGKKFDPNHHQKKFGGATHHQQQAAAASGYQNGIAICGGIIDTGMGMQGYNPAPLAGEDMSMCDDGDYDDFGGSSSSDAALIELKSVQCAYLEEQHRVLETDLGFFLEVVGQREGMDKIKDYMAQFAGAKSDSPLAEMFQKMLQQGRQ